MTPMERPRFDLTREPWIPCETLGGLRVELGFQDVLLRAHELASIHDESPLATAVLHRLALAILHRVVAGPRDLEHWQSLWEQARFEPAGVHAYFEKWRHRLDLFHEERPFLQVARLSEVMFRERDGKQAEAIPAARLALERCSSAGAIALLEHGGEELGLQPGEAARAMLGFHGFGPGGRILNDSGYPRGCPLRSGAVVLARGQTLHQTLLLNLLVPAPGIPPSNPDDAPAWEQEEPARRSHRAVRGWLDALTWQARRVELVPEMGARGVVVRTAITGAGLEPEGGWLEPMHAMIVRDPKRGPETIGFRPERSLWRDLTALLQTTPPQQTDRRPAVCTQIAQLVERDVLDRANHFALDLHGLASNQASIDLWRSERVPLPLPLLMDADRLHVVQEGLGAAELGASALRGSVWLLARHAISPGDRSPDKKDIEALVKRLDARSRYWGSLGARVDRFFQEAAVADDTDVVLVGWKTSVVQAARRALADAAQQLGTNARALQARAHAERHLHRSKELSELLPPPVSPPTQEGALT